MNSISLLNFGEIMLRTRIKPTLRSKHILDLIGPAIEFNFDHLISLFVRSLLALSIGLSLGLTSPSSANAQTSASATQPPPHSIRRFFSSSSRRRANETFFEATERLGIVPDNSQFKPSTASALSSSHPLTQIQPSLFPEWQTPETFQQAFENIRDERFLNDSAHPDFVRRISWLYPDDGCYARAELMAQKLIAQGHPAPVKVFAFGNLRANTPYSPTGSVDWWYHVVIGYRIGSQIEVFDPSVEPLGPLTMENWLKKIGASDTAVLISVCDVHALEPESQCLGGTSISESSAISQEDEFLNLEWVRLLDLNLDPHFLLGSHPPWRSM